MAATLATPGVYIEEKSSFGSSVVPVQTAIPAFVGYTEKASRGSKDLTNIPTKISSLGQYEELFGGAPLQSLTLKPLTILLQDFNFHLLKILDS